MHSEYGAEYAILIPAYEQLDEIGILAVGGHEAANIRSPPGNARKTHVLSCNDLILEGLEVGLHITCPYQHPVFLGAYPCGAEKVHSLCVADAVLPLSKCPCVVLGVFAAYLGAPAGKVSVIVEVVGGAVGLGVVQPEQVYAQILVVLLALVPDKLPCLGVEVVNGAAVALIVVGLYGACICGADEPLLIHFVVVAALLVHGGPYGYHDLCAFRMDLIHHGLYLVTGPVLLVKAPVTLIGPVEEVYYDNVQVNP